MLIEPIEDPVLCETLIKRVIQPLIIPLEQKLSGLKQTMINEGGRLLHKSEINEVTLRSIQGYLYLIGEFLKNCLHLHTRTTNPYTLLFSEIWNFIQDIIKHFPNIDDFVEFSIRIVKSSQRILGRAGFDPYLIEFLKIVISGYKQNHISSFIYSVEFSLQEYGTHRELGNIFQEAFDHICETTAKDVLCLPQAFTEMPDICADFFGLCQRLIRPSSQTPMTKKLFFSSPFLE